MPRHRKIEGWRAGDALDIALRRIERRVQLAHQDGLITVDPSGVTRVLPLSELAGMPGVGDVKGPASSTDNAIARFDGVTGKLLQNSAVLLLDDGRISSLSTPTGATDATTKAYVDALIANVGRRSTVRVATTADITIATALNSGDTLDGVTLATGDLVLVKNQATAAQNGVWIVGVTPVRATEFDTYDEHPGSLISVQEGTANADTLWLCTSNLGGVLDTTAIVFAQFSGSGGVSMARIAARVIHGV